MTERDSTPRTCLCGCGGLTKSTFVPGHDMRYKSALFAKALAGDSEALAQVEARGWSEILETKRTKAKRKATVKADRVAKAKPNGRPAGAANDPMTRLELLNTMKAAAEKLKGLGRYGKSAGDRRIPITAENAYQIVAGTHPDL